MKKIYRGKLVRETDNIKVMPSLAHDIWYTPWLDTERAAMIASENELQNKAKHDCTKREVKGFRNAYALYHNETLREVKIRYYFQIESAYSVHEHVGQFYEADEKDWS
jgi:hypothetical protein